MVLTNSNTRTHSYYLSSHIYYAMHKQYFLSVNLLQYYMIIIAGFILLIT